MNLINPLKKQNNKLLQFILMGLFLFFAVGLHAQNKVEMDAIKTAFQNQVNAGEYTEQDVSEWSVTAEHVSSTSGLHHIYLRQTHNGLEVNAANASAHLKSDGSLFKFNVGFVSNLQSKISGTDTPAKSAIEAVQDAAHQLGYTLRNSIEIVEKKGKNSMVLSKGGISIDDIPAKLIYAYKDGEYVLSWNIAIHELGGKNYWNIRVDAKTGEIISKNNWTVTCNFGPNDHDHALCLDNHTSEKYELKHDEAEEEDNNLMPMVGAYRVYPLPLQSPHYGGRSLINNPDDPTASPFGWHDTDGLPGSETTTTTGNNVDAFENGNNPGYRPVNAGLNFDYPINEVYSAGDQSEDAILTNLFYWNNIIHDITYQYGFDEASGNFQTNNYGNGGVAGDQVNAWGQTGLLCNAFFATPVDGGSGTMQMYVGSFADCGAPVIHDGSIDNMVMVHEYGHGISNRLTGGAGDSDCLDNLEQMGEGWSDWYGIALTMQAGHTATTNRTVANWLFGQPQNGGGIRAFPYNTDMGVNPHTYSSISGAGTPHGLGSVWCMMLWEMTWNLIETHGFDADFYNGSGGNNVALTLITEALKLQPCSPGFIDGRDAILAADQAIYGGAHACEIWSAFAKRGLGENATQGDTDNINDGTEDFTIPAGLCPVPNDLCADAEPLNCGADVTIDITSASGVDNPGTCVTLGSNEPGVWYTVVGTGGNINITTCNPGTNYDTKITVWEGTCGNLTCVTGNDDQSGGFDPACDVTGIGFNRGSTVDFCSTSGTTYHIYLYGFASAVGTAQMTITCDPALAVQCPPIDLGTLPCGTPFPPAATTVAEFNALGGSITGGCSPTISSVDDVTGDQCSGFMLERTYTIEDQNFSFECTQTAEILPPNPLTITCPADITVACEDEIMLDPNDAMVTTDCGLGFFVYIRNPIPTGIPGCNGTTWAYEYVATDDCGNVVTCIQTVTIENTPATITVPPGGVVECYEDIDIGLDDATVENVCADFNLYLVPPVVNGELGCPGTIYTFVYRVVDVCGNIIEGPVVFANGPNDPPTIEAPADITCECLAGVNPNPNNAIVTTSCTIGSTVTVSDPHIFGPIDCPGTIYRYTYTVEDDCGRTATDIQDFTVSNGPPVFENCPEDNWLVLNCEDFGGEDGTIQVIQAWIASVTASTSCGVPLTVFNDFNPGSLNTCISGLTTVTFTATDNCGRATMCNGTIIVVDTEAPEIITEAQDHYEMCNYNTPDNFDDWVDEMGGAVAYDGCSEDNVTWITSPGNPSINCEGAMGTTSVTVNFIVTDNCGNKTSTTATFYALMGGGDYIDQDEIDKLNWDKGGVESAEIDLDTYSGNNSIISAKIQLFQNRPNPFKDETLISFSLPKAGEATLTIYDVNGKALKVVEGNFNQGLNEVNVSRSELNGSGVLFYTLRSQNETAAKIMVLMD